MKTHPPHLAVRRLEDRLAPAATAVNATTVRYTDADGDAVTVQVSRGALDPARLTLTPAGRGEQLTRLDLTGAAFQGAGVTVTARRAGPAGDGLANVGAIDATGVDLGAVVVGGDLGQIDAGNPDRPAPALLSLRVRSLGRFGLDTQGGAGDLTSAFDGRVGPVAVATDVVGATLTAGGAGARLDAVTVGGSVLGGAVMSDGSIGPVRVGGDLAGGDRDYSGEVRGVTAVGPVAVGGSVVGGGGRESGAIQAGSLARLAVGGSVVGGSGFQSGLVYGQLRGDLAGAPGTLGVVTVGGSLTGGSATLTGSVYAEGAVNAVTVGGSLTGAAGSNSGAVYAGGAIGTLRVGGSLTGGGGYSSGSVYAYGDLGRVTVGGSVVGGTGLSAGITTTGSLGPVTIRGDVRGQPGTPVAITAAGHDNPRSQAASVAIQSLAVGGSVQNAFVAAGYDANRAAANPSASIGAVAVGGDWVTSSLVAGVDAQNGQFGDADDARIAGDTAPAVVARIAGVRVGGQVVGTAGTGDHFGFVAQQVGSFRVGDTAIPLSATVLDAVDLGQYGDVTIREVP